mmetsp:Transcript_643/g.642  ORF Transcript_643/g.642 Transcript_643/m.642 type:complete len:248 (+) Transcript_643:2-745(+)
MNYPKDEISLQHHHLGQYHHHSLFLFVLNYENYCSNSFLYLFTLEVGLHLTYFFFTISLLLQCIYPWFFLNLYFEYSIVVFIIRFFNIFFGYYYLCKGLYFFNEENKSTAKYAKITINLLFLLDVFVVCSNTVYSIFPREMIIVFDTIQKETHLGAFFTHYIVLIFLGSLYIAVTLYLNWIIYSVVVLLEKEHVYTIIGERELHTAGSQSDDDLAQKYKSNHINTSYTLVQEQLDKEDSSKEGRANK